MHRTPNFKLKLQHPKVGAMGQTTSSSYAVGKTLKQLLLAFSNQPSLHLVSVIALGISTVEPSTILMAMMATFPFFFRKESFSVSAGL